MTASSLFFPKLYIRLLEKTVNAILSYSVNIKQKQKKHIHISLNSAFRKGKCSLYNIWLFFNMKTSAEK